jgi:hypothetical protein
VILDHSPVPIESFKGLFGIDSFRDSVPIGFSIGELNLITLGNELKTRDGFKLDKTTSGIQKAVIYRRQGEAARILALIGSSIWDLTTNAIILTSVGMTDFAVNYSNNRAFISPHNGNAGLPGEFVYVYNGVGSARKAAGNAPIPGFTAVVSSTTGIIEAGSHLFAWVFQTDSGFVTAPGEAKILEFDGTKQVDFPSIPVGPAGTAARRLIASRAIQDYNGNDQGYEMFFVPGGLVNNNTATSLIGIDFYDVDLQLSADYTYDQLAEIPAVVFLSSYGKRMAYGGPDTDKNLVYISNLNEPESIHSSAGFIALDPFETEGVKDAAEFRDNFYIMKRTKTYTVRDNTYEPSTWNPVTLDSSIGCDVNGIAKFYDSKGTKVEFFTVASPAGLYKFTGTYEDIAMSRNIKSFWDTITKTYLHKLQIIFDQERLLLYILVPFNGSSENSHIFVVNYENGFQADRVKWHIWQFQEFAPSSIFIDRDANKKTVLKVSSLSGNIYAQEENRHNDDLSAIEQRVNFGYVGNSDNTIKHCGAIGLRIVGLGDLKLTLTGQDDVDFQALGDLTLSTTPGKEYIRPAFFQSEKIGLNLSFNNVNWYFKLHRVNVYTNVIFNSRPNV